jgi:hypothetical protein
VPRIHQDAILRDDDRDVRRADVAESLAGGDEQGRSDLTEETSGCTKAGPSIRDANAPTLVRTVDQEQVFRAYRPLDGPDGDATMRDSGD